MDEREYGDTTNSCPNCNSMALELERLRNENARLLALVREVVEDAPKHRCGLDYTGVHFMQVGKKAAALLAELEDSE